MTFDDSNRRTVGALIVVALLFALTAYLVYKFEERPWNTSGAPRTDLKILKRALYYMEESYIDPDKLRPQALIEGGLRSLEQGLAPIVAKKDEMLTVSAGGSKRTFVLHKKMATDDIPDLFGHVVDFIKMEVPEGIKDENLEYMILDGITSSLDPHSNFLRPKVYSEFRIGTTGNFGGLGIAIGIRDGYLTVIAPLDGTPAYRAGIKAKDRIVQIGDERTINMSLTEAVEKLRGKVGTKVSIIVRREGVADPIPFVLQRALIRIESVKGERVGRGDIVLVKIKNFQEDTYADLDRLLQRLSEEKVPKGIILDLRNNPGGLLDQAVLVADTFLADGAIVTTVGSSNEVNEEEIAEPNDDPYEEVPIVVLVDEGSASASEILAGALQVHDRAIVIGKQTFGKGTVQTIYGLKDGSALKITIAKYLAGGTEDVQMSGIVPDVVTVPVHITEKKIDLVENRIRREYDLEMEGSYQGPPEPTREPAFKIHYLEEEREKEEAAGGMLDLERDYPVWLAEQILIKGGGELSVEGLDTLLGPLRKKEEAKIAEKLSVQRIDWQAGKRQTGAPIAEMRFSLTEGRNTTGTIRSGIETTLNLTVKNSGLIPFYRLIAVSECENGYLGDLEFVFGNVAPGEERTYSVPVTLPKSSPSQKVPIKLTFREEHGHTPPPIEKVILIEARPPPGLSYKWGTGGKIVPGREIDLRFVVENRGPGGAEKVVLNLTNLGGDKVFLSNGRAEIGSMPPGSRKDALLRLKIKEGIPDNLAPLQLSIEDADSGYVLVDDFTLSISDRPNSPVIDSLQIPPTFSLELPEDPYMSTRDSYLIRGKASDDRKIDEVYAFNNSKKVFYAASDDDVADKFLFSIKVPLEGGANRIMVVAKDDDGLVTRERWIVWKAK